jgi:glycosyltransferase involved in cell wall biosynthesis
MSKSGLFIVMATYNGAQWLPDQIRSIQSQTQDEWTLLVSDDGSDDETAAIVEQAAVQDERIRLLRSREGEAGHVANFEYLLERALDLGAKTVFLADQDDVWAPNKLHELLILMAGHPTEPLVCFSDMELIDAHGVTLGSFLERVNFDGKLDVRSLLRQNFLAGCSLAVNAQLLELALPFPEKLENHDWWLGMCAAVSNGLIFCPEKLVLYRQHDGNTVGAGTTSSQVRRIRPILQRQRRVFESKLSAVDELSSRLKSHNMKVPSPLCVYSQDFLNASVWVRAFRFLFGDFRPRSVALCFVQLLAILTVTGDRSTK